MCVTADNGSDPGLPRSLNPDRQSAATAPLRRALDPRPGCGFASGIRPPRASRRSGDQSCVEGGFVQIHFDLALRSPVMNQELLNKRIAILAADGFEQVELEKPKQALEEAGATVSIVSPSEGKIQGMHHADKGDKFDVDLPLKNAKAEEFDGLMIPGGLLNPDTLRSTPDALEFTRAFFLAGKPVAAICHAPWVLIDAGVVKGRKLTSWPAIQTDMKNAGGNWVDEEVV